MKPATPYDEIPYPGHAYPQTHPDRLSTIARLYGMRPAPVDRCRVLELGSGDGANLIPMALVMPDSEFLGVDLAPSPVLRGQRLVSQLGLENIRLEVKDLMDLSPEGAPFDYIIAHGLYSWVPPSVQERIFQILERWLSPQGVAYISYNTLPGGHIRLMLREMMLYHCERFDLPHEKIDQVQSLMRHLAEGQTKPNRYGMLLRDEWESNLSSRSPQVLFHDEMGEYNTNIYFHQFMTKAAQHHLQFLSEADFRDMQPTNIEPSVLEFLQEFGDDILSREQYLDFVYGKRFRQTLLCRSSISVDRRVTVDRVTGLLASANTIPESFLPLDASDSPIRFVVNGYGPDSSSITTSHPLVKAALASLSQAWPASLTFESLWDAAHDQLHLWGSIACLDSSDDRNGLAKTLFTGCLAGLIELHSWRPSVTSRPGVRPLASPLARLQSLTEDMVTTLCHEQVEIREKVSKVLLGLLDGTRDHTMILRDLEKAILSHKREEPYDEESCNDVGRLMKRLRTDLDNHLVELARLGLLIS